MSIISQAKHTGEHTETKTVKVGIGREVISWARIVYRVQSTVCRLHTVRVRKQTLVFVLAGSLYQIVLNYIVLNTKILINNVIMFTNVLQYYSPS